MNRVDPDVIVVGGGLIGCLVARALADDGRRVTVLERGTELGRRASTAAAGMLSPQMEWAEELLPDSEVMLELCVRARELWPEFARRLEALSGRPDCITIQLQARTGVNGVFRGYNLRGAFPHVEALVRECAALAAS